MENITGEWVTDSRRRRFVKVKTDALYSCKETSEEDILNIVTFYEFETMKSMYKFKETENQKEFKTEYENIIKEKDKMIESQFKTIERLLGVIEKVTTPIITIQDKNTPIG